MVILLIFSAAAAVAFVGVCFRWRKRRMTQELNFAGLVAEYRRQFGHTPAGAGFLSGIRATPDIAADPGSALSRGVTAVSTAHYLGMSTEDAAANGFAAAAGAFLASMFSRVRQDIGKSQDQIGAEVRIAEFLRSFAAERSQSRVFLATLLVTATGFVACYLVLTVPFSVADGFYAMMGH